MSIHIVEAKSVADYLARYYKQDRLKDLDKAYGDNTLLSLYEIEYRHLGFICTSPHSSVTGQFIAWPTYKISTQEEIDNWMNARQEFEMGIVNPVNIDAPDELTDLID